MPQYDFRCETCQGVFSVGYRTYAEYDSAAPSCPECRSLDLTRLISKVSIGGTRRDYSKMSSGEMLSVLEAGDQSQVRELFKQVGGADSNSAAAVQEASAAHAHSTQEQEP